MPRSDLKTAVADDLFIADGQELRITCKRDPSRSVYNTTPGASVRDEVMNAYTDFGPLEFGWLARHGGAETDDWLIRLTDRDEPLYEGTEQRP